MFIRECKLFYGLKIYLYINFKNYIKNDPSIQYTKCENFDILNQVVNLVGFYSLFFKEILYRLMIGCNSKLYKIKYLLQFACSCSS